MKCDIVDSGEEKLLSINSLRIMSNAKKEAPAATDSKESVGGKGYDFGNYKKDSLTKPRDLAWSNWAKFESVNDTIQGFIRDAFYRPAEGKFKEQRGITVEQLNGELVNVGIKRYPFVLNKTDDLRIGDPVTIVLEELRAPKEKGLNATKVFGFYGTNLPANTKNKTVKELEEEDMKRGGTVVASEEDKAADQELEEF